MNEGKTDRLLRLIAAVIIALAAFFKFSGVMQIVAYIIALFLLITAGTGFSLLYSLFGISTQKKIP